MELIKVEIMTNKYDGQIRNQGDLEESFTCYGKSKTIFLNPSQIQYKTDIMECNEFYSPHKKLGRYFIVHCINGENYYMRENQFDKI